MSHITSSSPPFPRQVLAVNCGSSTLKFELREISPTGPIRRVAHGTADRIGGDATLAFHHEGGWSLKGKANIADHGEAVQRALRWLAEGGGLSSIGLALAHRVVHGGVRFTAPAIIDDAVLREIAALTELAPLHNGPALAAIRAAATYLGGGVPMVAVFDTAFHRTLPPAAALYALPRELMEKHQVQRYGFHGLAHRYMAQRYAAITSCDSAKLVTLQLGNGCSAAAVAAGRSLDTSMGFTPLEGLMMGTRSGDVDPSLPAYLAEREGVSVAEVDDWLNRKSGLFGVSGSSRDMRDLLERESQGDARAKLAIDMFCYRVRKCLGAYLAVLGGADAVIFGGGIGENAPAVRARICAGMEWCGLSLDDHRNDAAAGVEACISADSAEMHAHVIVVDEAAILVEDALCCLRA